MKFHVSAIQFKTVDQDARIIEGIASTPTPDRIGDSLDPKGAQFTLPMPLLWQHKQDQPIGKVIAAKVTAAGITIRAQISKGIASIDEKWELIKAGLVPGLSVGWIPIDGTRTKDGALKVSKWGWHETSTVTVPMNAETTILAIKAADAASRAESGLRSPSQPPAVAGSRQKAPATMKNYSEQRTATEAELQQKTLDLEALMDLDELTDDQTTERDSLTSEIDRLTARAKSYAALERVSERKAIEITPRRMGEPNGKRTESIIVEEPKLDPGIGFARVVLCKAASQFAAMKGEFLSANAIAKAWYPNSERTQLAVKAAVEPATTTHATWASPLVYNQTIADFVEYLRPKTLIGQFGQGNIPALNRVPFNMRQVTESAAMTANWVGQGLPKPLTKAGYTAATLGPCKVAAITVDTEELLRFANQPGLSAETAMRDGLTRAVVAKIDTSLVNPALAAVSNVNPASLTYGVTPIISSGNTADNLRADILSIFDSMIAANLDPRSFVLMTTPTVALSISLMVNSLGTPEFPNMTINGGTVQGIPVLVSNYLALAGYGNMLVGVVASEINLADDGQVTVDLSREASLEFTDAPTQSGTTGVSLISLWQNNLVAFRAERFINWGLRRSGVVAWVQSVNYGGIGSPF
jgi:HK97 family phage prohead protease/HK97 family phage major capsid protein